MISIDKNDIQNIVILKRVPEFKKLMELIKRRITELSIKNAVIKDEVLMHWNQGRVQELLDIIKEVESADENLRSYNQAPKRTPDI